MKTPAVQSQGTTGDTFQELMIGKEGLEMKADMEETNGQLFNALGSSVGARLFRVAALGALLVGAAALYSTMSQGEARSQPPSSETSQVSAATVYLTAEEHDLAELPYDELTRNFFGTGSPSRATLSIDQRFPPGALTED